MYVRMSSKVAGFVHRLTSKTQERWPLGVNIASRDSNFRRGFTPTTLSHTSAFSKLQNPRYYR